MQLQNSDDSLARSVALQRTPDAVVRAAVDVSRAVLNADSTFAAVNEGPDSYPITIMNGIRDTRFGGITVRAGAGLGGQVLLRGQPLSIADYAHDPAISSDFVHVVSHIEGLSGMACVPIVGPSGVEALLYVASRINESPGDIAIGVLERVATYAQLALHQLAAREHELELELLKERQRLANELHDSVAQMLFAIGVAAHYSRRLPGRSTLLAALEEIEATAAHARRELRETLQRLGRHGVGIGFEARLEGEIRLFERSSRCALRVTRGGEPRQLPEPVEDLILDTLIEGLRNLAKHTTACSALAHLGYGADRVTLALHAHIACPPLEARDPWKGEGTGTGLALLEQRASQLRGTLAFESERGGHQLLRLELPTVATRSGA
jgi:signal transduction histidine kinase